jgi:uncharacterized protein (DUF433 family)
MYARGPIAIGTRLSVCSVLGRVENGESVEKSCNRIRI